MAQVGDLVVTGSSRFLNKINGTCTDGSAGTTKYLRQDGTWQVPPNSGGTVTSITLKATSPIAIDSTSAITTSGTRTLSHANSGVTAGTYQSVTVNATGHVTAGAALTKAQVTTALGYTPPTSDTNTTYTIGTSGNNITLTPSSGSAQSITVPYATKAGSATDSTKLPLAGGTMTGQIMTSFKSAVAMGSRQSDATTVPDLCNDLRYSSGCCGSVSIGTAYTLNNITVAKGWYNYLWVPHRSGGNSGTASGDNCDYGSLYLSGMTLSGCYMIRYASAAIAELRNLYADTNTTYGLGTSGNSITIVAGGTTTSITAPYATSAGSATTAGNVTGTVAIANGGTGATTRLNALKALTNENVGTNATYFLTITDSWGKGGYSSVANVKTVLGLGSAAYKDASGSWGISVTGSSASCTGNAATASVASKLSITKATPASTSSAYVTVATDSGDKTVYADDGMTYVCLNGSTSTLGYGRLNLGNNIAVGTAGNRSGILRLYSSSGYGEIQYAVTTSNTTHYLPATGGTLLNSGTTSFTQTLTSGTKIGSIKINGTSTDIFAPSGVSNIHSGAISSNTAVTVTLTSSNAIGFLARGSSFDVTSQGWFIIINKSIKYYNTLGASYVRYDDSTNKIAFINVNKSNYVVFEF